MVGLNVFFFCCFFVLVCYGVFFSGFWSLRKKTSDEGSFRVSGDQIRCIMSEEDLH